MSQKVVILSRSFAAASPAPLEYLADHGVEALRRPNSRPEDEAAIAEAIGDADAVIVGSDRIGRLVFERCPNLRVVSKHGVGLDAIDLGAARERGVQVFVTAGANAAAVADTTWLLILAASRRLRELLLTADNVLATYDGLHLGHDVAGKTLGVVGLGRIGRLVARRAQGFGCPVVAYDPLVTDLGEDAGLADLVPLDELFRRADIVTLHAPLTDETHHLIDAAALAAMKDGVVLVNTARAGLVDEAALVAALRSGHVRAAGIDVFAAEPPVGNPLLDLPNVVATPHVAAHSHEANVQMGLMAAANVVAGLDLT